jgi:hypothetical protein
MEKSIEYINNLEKLARKTRSMFISPLYRQSKEEKLQNLEKIKNALKLISEKILEFIPKCNLQIARIINIDKLKIFNEDILSLASKIERQIFLDKNKKEVKSELIQIKEEITNPEQYFYIEENTINLLNLFLSYLKEIQDKIKYNFTDINKDKKNTKQLLQLLEHKENKIKELNSKIKEYVWLESKEKAKSSRLSEIEDLLIKKTKASEQDLTILKLHVIQVEKELNEMYRHIKSLNNDISHLEAKFKDKENISLELIKELKDELLATRYTLSKQK